MKTNNIQALYDKLVLEGQTLGRAGFYDIGIITKLHYHTSKPTEKIGVFAVTTSVTEDRGIVVSGKHGFVFVNFAGLPALCGEYIKQDFGCDFAQAVATLLEIGSPVWGLVDITDRMFDSVIDCEFRMKEFELICKLAETVKKELFNPND